MPNQAPPQPEGWDELRAASRKSVAKRYKVVGHRAVYGIKPGETGTLTLTPSQESDLIEAGHIRPQPDPGQSPNQKVKE